jgi:hypothetical protein
MVGLSGFEPLTSRLSAVRSSQLSYRPVVASGSRFFRRGYVPKEPSPARRPSEWLPENWVDGFDSGEDEPGWIL